MKCYRKFLRIPWTTKTKNEEVLARFGIKTTTLLQNIKTLKLKYFGHVKRRKNIEKHILEAKVEDKRGRGRPTRRWEQDIEDWLGTTTTQAGRLTSDRVLFRRKVQEATSQSGIS